MSPSLSAHGAHYPSILPLRGNSKLSGGTAISTRSAFCAHHLFNNPTSDNPQLSVSSVGPGTSVRLGTLWMAPEKRLVTIQVVVKEPLGPRTLPSYSCWARSH